MGVSAYGVGVAVVCVMLFVALVMAVHCPWKGPPAPASAAPNGRRAVNVADDAETDPLLPV